MSFSLTSLLPAVNPVYAVLNPGAGGGGGADDVATLQDFGLIFTKILRSIIPLLGLALFVLLIVGGFQYLTAGGDPKQVQKASHTITTAIIGLVVVIGVWFIFKILGFVTGLELLKFTIPGSA